MIQGLSDTALLRIAIVIAALVLFLVIWLTARRKSAQGRRVAPAGGPERSERTEPTLRELIETGTAHPGPSQVQAPRPRATRAVREQEPGLPPKPSIRVIE